MREFLNFLLKEEDTVSHFTKTLPERTPPVWRMRSGRNTASVCGPVLTVPRRCML